ncbi:hypothetical protein L195_g060454 [Trifolium pratense]|uniref:Uncharacterized protein n=1 Tax=Trifolium pratense TaxID=57577 RepID=A0A2K3K3X8_TRIPR|nr:hypothetical protein L195_g060454 [Trifolium pratense]
MLVAQSEYENPVMSRSIEGLMCKPRSLLTAKAISDLVLVKCCRAPITCL